MRKKGMMMTDTLLKWIIFIAVLVLLIILIGLLITKGSGALDYVKHLLSFR